MSRQAFVPSPDRATRSQRTARAPAQPTSGGGMPRYLRGSQVRVSHPADPGEQHADHIVEQVMAPTVPAPSPTWASETAGRHQATPSATRQLGPGRELDADSRGFFEPRFGRDLGHVRVHADEPDGLLARSFSARAFTTGRDIVFAPGQYAPGTESGRRLIAHELAHVVAPTPAGVVARQADGGVDAGTATVDAGVRQDAGIHDASVPIPAGVPPTPAPMFDPLYGACPTPEEGARRDAFALRRFHLERNIPSTTFGMFDADWYPLAMGLMPVTVKIKFNFVSADNAPGFWEAMRRQLGGQDVSRFFWSDSEKADFKRDYISRVTTRWSGQHSMVSTKPCWRFSALPIVTPTEVDSDSAAHYVATVHKSPGPGIDYKSGTNDPDLAHPDRPATADLYSSDVRENPDFNSGDVAKSERQRIESALAGSVASPVLFDKDSDAVRPAARSALTGFADALKQKNPSDPPIPLHIDGFASMEGNRAHNVDLANRRAVAVRALLASLGVPQPMGVLGHGPVGAPEDAANRKVDISVDHTFETTYAGNRYSVGEHEFGHMLGLPDEYLNATTGTPGTQQTLFMSLVTAAGVRGPAVWGVRTASQMADGVDVLPRHYVTLWEALGRMTTPDITQAQWRLR
jgi:outer membrane protein OmpA-like peptidoglycan-associated protein